MRLSARRNGPRNPCVAGLGHRLDYKEFAGRPHFPTAPGWEAVADYALDWANRHVERGVGAGREHRQGAASAGATPVA
jgi:hypothetical protein